MVGLSAAPVSGDPAELAAMAPVGASPPGFWPGRGPAIAAYVLFKALSWRLAGPILHFLHQKQLLCHEFSLLHHRPGLPEKVFTCCTTPSSGWGFWVP
jgi:hypothetical protein